MPSYVYGCGPCCEWKSWHSSLLGRMAEAMGHALHVVKLGQQSKEEEREMARHKRRPVCQGSFAKTSAEPKEASVRNRNSHHRCPTFSMQFSWPCLIEPTQLVPMQPEYSRTRMATETRPIR